MTLFNMISAISLLDDPQLLYLSLLFTCFKSLLETNGDVIEAIKMTKLLFHATDWSVSTSH